MARRRQSPSSCAEREGFDGGPHRRRLGALVVLRDGVVGGGRAGHRRATAAPAAGRPLAQQAAALVGKDAARERHAVRHRAPQLPAGHGLHGVQAGAEPDALDAGVVNGGEAHGAGLHGHVELAAGERRRPQVLAGRPQREDLRVGGGVGTADDGGVGTGDDPAVLDHAGAHRRLAGELPALRGGQGLAHGPTGRRARSGLAARQRPGCSSSPW